jgi:hypothetical protein
VRRVAAGHYQVEANGFHYDVVKHDIPVVNWVILKNGEKSDEFPKAIGRYGKARDLVYADIENERLKKEQATVTDPNMAIQHLDTTGTDRPTGNAAGPANTPYITFETATPVPEESDLGSNVTMGEEETVERFDEDEDENGSDYNATPTIDEGADEEESEEDDGTLVDVDPEDENPED